MKIRRFENKAIRPIPLSLIFNNLFNYIFTVMYNTIIMTLCVCVIVRKIMTKFMSLRGENDRNEKQLHYYNELLNHRIHIKSQWNMHNIFN